MSRPVDRRTAAALTVLALASGGIGYALGRQGSQPDRGETYLQALQRDLDLRPEQVEAVDRLLAREDADLAALVDDSRDALRDPVAARRRQTEHEMLSLLDDEQRARYEALSRP
ncbi:MAG: hypothetical protein H6825_08815 [Planctomycetes bacterium]|nr:hypothetical protein [Planctomycetota bacterium]